MPYVPVASNHRILSDAQQLCVVLSLSRVVYSVLRSPHTKVCDAFSEKPLLEMYAAGSASCSLLLFMRTSRFLSIALALPRAYAFAGLSGETPPANPDRAASAATDNTV